MIIHGDCLEALKELPDNSVDSVVTDPPYGLSFMGKKWDYDVPSEAIWREVLRVLKPGGHLLSFCGTRTYHRMVVRIEDAGFEIRDQIQWIYGSGFPKSLDVSKAIDKAAGAEREVVGHQRTNVGIKGGNFASGSRNEDVPLTAPSTESAKQWQGWGTALKPANEPICLARKPLEKGLTVAQNVQKWGTGAINVDASRIDSKPRKTGTKSCGDEIEASPTSFAGSNKRSLQVAYDLKDQGRWPANVLFDEEAAAVLDEQSGQSKSNIRKTVNHKASPTFGQAKFRGTEHEDSGGASRFFYVAKASKRERNAGLEGMPVKKSQVDLPQAGIEKGNSRGHLTQNHHPTVKPIKLMEYLITMITTPMGVVLDPFTGSGTTGVAATKLGFGFIGIERELEYVEIAKKRIEAAG